MNRWSPSPAIFICLPDSNPARFMSMAEQQRGNHRILFDVVNRGRKTALSLNGVPTADPTAPLAPGTGFLMRHGYTVVAALLLSRLKYCEVGGEPHLP